MNARISYHMISIVIPVLNEEKNAAILHQELLAVMNALNRPYEIIFVDDGSRDGTLAELKKLLPATVLSFSRNFGKSQALQAGFAEASGEYVITLDGDLQDDPREIPRFVEMLDRGADLVCGWKYNRLDPASKVFFSRIANTMTRLATGVAVHDMNCGFKGYRALVAKNLRLHGDLYRYIPALAASDGYVVREIKVNHRKRLYGESKYGVMRLASGFFDFMTLYFLRRFLDRPMHLFGSVGITSFFIGGGILAYLAIIRLAYGISIGSRPLLTLGVLLVLVGLQFFSLGLLGDLIISRTHGAHMGRYIIREKTILQ
ncbi:MAG: hypothetical protein A3I44_05950 [Candidatus Sungbacteria bacterium RIFCSPLOWO2_02_FULL_51_17]|nr:MAG: hypothetical protein A2676_01475 [Candidatus Sungbacteria bacterium RIFCSPHIGHO2_01_FULL_51_22]OHA06922.1 MAG: hypothetical protein A3B29_04865 [Candidatus Sungbacteria bacterium RIFCSPLOWO2_01_FULL_51_34]OHA12392.1 MAG: hypothetical protein A3I44_05950 [Candidatus Sungbacteria bacterium RIFCSPLOWO2_02_FULL_51_17]